MSRSKETNLINLGFGRPLSGPSFGDESASELPLSKATGWRSNGGPTRGHPARSFPFTLEAGFDRASVVRIHLVGVFAMYAEPELEVAGTLGATLQLYSGDELLFHQEMVNGVHYSDAKNLTSQVKTMGDGSSLATLGSTVIDRETYRVDVFTLDVPKGLEADLFKFKSFAGIAGFVIFDVILEHAGAHGCPFHSSGGGVPLARIASIVRLGDRVEFNRAIEQLAQGIAEASDLDEARGLGLTFIAVLTAALLETGGSKRLVLEQLHAAREVEKSSTTTEVWESVSARIENLVPQLLGTGQAHSDRLVNRALAIIERNYAKQLTDAHVAHQLGLSTSHFRFLFKQATGQPFHKYVIAARLEKAHQMLLEMESASVGSVAKAVGFVGLSHFSRAFTQRFKVSPASVRKSSA